MRSLCGRGLRQTDAVCCARDRDPRGTRRRTFKRTYPGRCPIAMNSLALVVALFAPAHPALRASWRPFLTPTGGLFGGPHAFMYVLGAEDSSALVMLDLPTGWEIATGLTPTRDPHTFVAPNAEVLVDSPILAGHLRQWRFVEGGATHRVVYWPLPNATLFDTARFVSGIQSMVHQEIGRASCRERV